MGSMGSRFVSLPSFVGTWVLMMAATMLPSALPFIRRYVALPGRKPWVIDGAALVTAYLAVWALLGLGAYYIYIAFGNARLPGSAALGLALCAVAIYGLTPVRRRFAATCRSICHDIEARQLLGAVSTGARYGVSCVGCSAGVMAVMLVGGMSSLVWMAVAAGPASCWYMMDRTRAAKLSSSGSRSWIAPARLITCAIAGSRRATNRVPRASSCGVATGSVFRRTLT